MSQKPQELSSDETGADEVYIASHREQVSYTGTRTATEWVPFFLPHLRPGMSLLDCGCGVGSITLDLAERVAPGQVVGVDLDASQIALARAEAGRRGLSNVRFEVASIYELPFQTGSFDAALAHTLLCHLHEPLRALRVLRQMLKPGGVVCVSDDDLSTVVFSPEDPHLRKGIDLGIRLLEHNGASSFYARHLRGLMLEAGFARTEGHAVAADHYGTLEETRKYAQFVDGLFSHPAWIAPVLSEGWADEAELAEMRAGVLAWGERPDAFLAWLYCAAVGWVDAPNVA
jgi:SAM-dependent methyltransferase